MFGFVNNALENLVIRTYGFDTWKEVLIEAGVSLDDHHFLKSFLYDDFDTYALVDAACTVLNVTTEELMEKFGDQFFHWCEESGYDQMLRLLGRTLGEFLASLDALHDHLQLTYPGMQAPSFRIEQHPSHPKGLYLFYSSVRTGLQNVVRGIILTVARSIFHTEVIIDTVDTTQVTPFLFLATFSIVPASDDQESLLQQSSLTGVGRNKALSPGSFPPEDQVLSKASFCHLFPFHVLFDRDMEIKQMGNSLRRLLPPALENKSPLYLNKIMTMERPQISLSCDAILQHIHSVFAMKMRHSRVDFKAARLRGQMMYLPQIDCILYICSPRVHRLKELDEHGLYLSDIPLHDATREIVMTTEALNAHLNMVQKLEETTNELMVSKNALTNEKSRTDALLHSILPKSVARQILTKQEVAPEWFNEVTILFSDICGFTSICGECSPIEVIGMLNELYTLFDYLTTVNNVYKVETIGDAYMVVGGLPDRCADHASLIANFAMDMKHACSSVMRPDKPDEPIQIRIGFHSGEVMAGVVGTKTPRYCLFGDCVNIASRTESNGVAGRINLSDDAYVKLPQNGYILEDRGDVAFKGRSDRMHCWFLNGHNTRPPRRISIEQARQESSLIAAITEASSTTSLTEFEDGRQLHSASPGNTPKNSVTDMDMQFVRNTIDIGMAAAQVTSAQPRQRERKSSVVKAPVLEALAQDRTHHSFSPSTVRSVASESAMHARYSAPGPGVGGGCPFSVSAMNADGEPLRRMTRRASQPQRDQRSASDPVPPHQHTGSNLIMERHGHSISVVSTASSIRASRRNLGDSGGGTASGRSSPCLSRSPATLSASSFYSDSAPDSPSTPLEQEKSVDAPLSAASAASHSPLMPPPPPPPPPPSSDGWLRWYAVGSTAACLALLSLQLYQRVKH